MLEKCSFLAEGIAFLGRNFCERRLYMASHSKDATKEVKSLQSVT